MMIEAWSPRSSYERLRTSGTERLSLVTDEPMPFTPHTRPDSFAKMQLSTNLCGRRSE
jgi:hypothetical protein